LWRLRGKSLWRLREQLLKNKAIAEPLDYAVLNSTVLHIHVCVAENVCRSHKT